MKSKPAYIHVDQETRARLFSEAGRRQDKTGELWSIRRLLNALLDENKGYRRPKSVKRRRTR